MHRSFPILPLVFAALLFSGCSSTVQVGRDFELSSISSKIERGVTTKSAIINMLGNPSNTGQHVATDGQTYEEWTYYFATGSLPNLSNPNLKMLQIKFDKQGIVQGYNWTASGK